MLLFFIERDELDIYDIPISKITKDFLNYLQHMEKMNIEVASEFILVAATLMRIKSKMLLPRPELDEQGNEIDPREELVKHLLEYKKYKSVVAELARMEDEHLQQERRGNIMKELHSLATSHQVEAELQDLDLYKLLKVFQRVMERHELEKDRPIHRVVPYPYTITGQKEFLLGRLLEEKRISFERLVELEPNRIGVIFNFLAILELLQLQLITIQVGLGFNNFWIEPNENPQEEELEQEITS